MILIEIRLNQTDGACLSGILIFFS